MTPADAIGRRDEVRAAFLEGWRKGHAGIWISDREAWEQSTALARLAYGVFPACPKCGCQIINPNAGNPPPCLKCGMIRLNPTNQHKEREADQFEAARVEQVLRHPLDQPGDGRDTFSG